MSPVSLLNMAAEATIERWDKILDARKPPSRYRPAHRNPFHRKRVPDDRALHHGRRSARPSLRMRPIQRSGRSLTQPYTAHNHAVKHYCLACVAKPIHGGKMSHSKQWSQPTSESSLGAVDRAAEIAAELNAKLVIVG